MKSRTFILMIFAGLTGICAAQDRYEAEDAIVDSNSIQKVADPLASGGFYINMKEGNLSFKVNVENPGFYTVWTSYSQPNDNSGKIQNLSVNGASAGQISFPRVDTFVYIKASSKVKLSKGNNTIGITKSWGWVNIDYIEITPYEPMPFSISNALVAPRSSENAKKLYSFIKENFLKKIISGAMTNTVMLNDGKYTPNTIENQTETAWIKEVAGKFPALLGFDFFHATGLNSDGEWHKGYTNATIAMAEDFYKRGGIPVYCWHWKDPGHKVEAFYSPSSGNSPSVSFDLKKAYTDTSKCESFNTGSTEYKSIVRDIDIIAGYLKILADKGIPVLWRPLHEASGKWFWWGYSGAKACKGLYKLVFERLTGYHGLDNLVWIWTTDEAGDALDWYPGDDYVDIIGRDYYYYPEVKNHGSLVASFEKIKEIFGGKKIIALSENGSIPHPDSMIGDEAGWSFFMPWYGQHTRDVGAGTVHNTSEDWKYTLNHDYVITLDEMPGWDDYKVSSKVSNKKISGVNIAVRYTQKVPELVLSGMAADKAAIYTLQGKHIATLNRSSCGSGFCRFRLDEIPGGLYLVRLNTSFGAVARPFLVK